MAPGDRVLAHARTAIAQAWWARRAVITSEIIVPGYPGRPPCFKITKRSNGGRQARRRRRGAGCGQTPGPERLSPSVIDPVGPEGAEFALIA